MHEMVIKISISLMYNYRHRPPRSLIVALVYVYENWLEEMRGPLFVNITTRDIILAIRGI